MSEPEQLSLVPPEEPEATDATEALPTLPQPHPPTPEQAAAIDARDRDVFLEAGAGTGKTRVLVSRYCDAIDLDGIEPERILAFTFTERAAAEMRRRVRVELARRAASAENPERRALLTAASRSGEGTPITTIHGFCRHLLASHPVAAGLDPRFRVLDAEEASRLATEAYERALNERAAVDGDLVRAAAGYRWRLSGIIRAAHSELRNHGERRPALPPIQITGLERIGADDPGSVAMVEQAGATYDALRGLLEAYGRHYEELCASRSGIDFDDLQLMALELLRERRSIAEAQRERFDHMLVDEFQDTSPIQVELVRALAGPATRVFAVGDEFQSIYAFRGADLSSFRRERDRIRERAAAHPEEAVALPLSGSFRSDPDVVAMVNAVGHALLDDFRPLRVGRLPDGPPPGRAGEPAIDVLLTRRKGWTESETQIPTAHHEAPQSRVAEARFLARRLRELAGDGVDPAGMVVLLRAFTNVDVYAEALELAGLDPHVIGGRGYWSAQQVADAMRLLNCIANPLDDESLLGALASPACGVSPDALWILRRIAGRRRHLWPALDGLFRPPPEPDPGAEEPEEVDERELEQKREAETWSGRLPDADRERLRQFHERLELLRSGAALLPLDTLVERTLQTFGYDLATLLMENGSRRTANLHKLVRIATEYEAHDGRNLRGFLDHAASRAAFSDREAEAAAGAEAHAGVRVMTVHAAKGLEFETVAVADLGRRLCIGGQPPELRIDFDAEEAAAARDEGPPPARVGLRLARAGAGAIDTEGYSRLNDDAADAEAEESGRLVYVAASRAERRLILSGVYDDKDLEESDKPRRSRTALGCLLPRIGADGADGQVVEIEAPAPREGLEAAFDPATVSIHVIGAGAETAALLAIDHRERSDQAHGAIGGRPPLLATAERGAAAARNLSYAALADYRRCGYRFLTERVLGLGAVAQAAAPEAGRFSAGAPDGAATAPDWDEEPPAGVSADAISDRAARMGFGRAVHDLLEWSALNGWRAPSSERGRSTLAAHGGDRGAAARALELVAGWLDSELLAEMRDGVSTFRPELPFRLALGDRSILRGTIDLLASSSDGAPTIIDYKTDSLAGGIAHLDEAYELQRSLYAAAVAEATGADEIRSAYVFLQRPDEPQITILGIADLAAGRERIAELLDHIRAADFAPTPAPYAALCHDCPARARLCPHPPEMTMRAEP